MIKTKRDLNQRNHPRTAAKSAAWPARLAVTLEKKNLVAKGNQDLQGTIRICALKTIGLML